MSTVISAGTPMLTVPEAARRLGLTEGRIRQLLRSGHLRGQKLSERLWGIPIAEIERFAGSRLNPNRDP